MLIQEPVQAAIWHCMNHYAYSDAIFLAERLCAEFDSDESTYLLATCYYRAGKPSQAYTILSGKKIVSEKCKFLLARCCIDLHKLSEAETILTGNVGDLISSSSCASFIESIVSSYGDSAPFALQLISHVWWRSERAHLAAEACRKALYLNPFLWQSFQDLCDRGVKPDPEPFKIFKVDNLDNFSKCLGSNSHVISTPLSTYNVSYESINTFNSTPAQKMINMSVPSSNSSISSGIQPFTPDINNAKAIFVRPIGRKVKVINENAFSPLTPSFGVFPLESPDSNMSSQSMVLVPSGTLNETNDQKFISKRSSKPVFSQSGNTGNINNLGTQQVSTPPSPMSHVVRRSSRIITNSCSVKENNKSPSKKFTSPKSVSRKIKTGIVSKKTVFTDITERNPKDRGGIDVETTTLAQQALNLQKKTAEGLMSLLRDIGVAYLQLSKFNCKKAIQLFQNLPPQQHKTGFVLSMIGKAYCEQSDYLQSIKYFSVVRELEPYRDTLMELYSTALWHQQKEVALSSLAQDMTTLDRNSSSTWCVVGNCFSLQKEHQTAIKYFQRAIQVNPDFPYAYALLGNEYLVTEELEKAITCFQKAVKLDPRHYKSWYGIGAIYQKQERFELAEMHYKRALRINHSSALIMCHIAVVQNSMDKPDQALHTLHIALSLEPKHPMCKYQRAQIYSKLGKLQEALYELEELKEIVPQESLVYFLTGKVHKKLGNIHLALMNFNRATDLDPKGASNQIKEAIEPTNNQSPLDDSVLL
ncbi:cell division cycle protein 27 homolog isoform X2 [Daktulosphaira vitifoliae]|uniref:cell division cycle protein 27 homolog isoform X2 n=1 Tax=Daktulosphaira vitifoliae TaxID=58002 RepID=UPI0021AAB8D1|nr:cell division cycle protein 27 homolog isoform X2 [Daktulosphaira vitifoliae]